ncbi:MAG TPA: SRPBCC family protein [Mycobacteriales bacterium]
MPASVEEVWAAATDWAGQREWVLLTDVRQTGDATIEAFTGWRGIGFTDPMTVTTWDPPHRCVVRHDGRVVRGWAAFEVQPAEGGARLVWTEWLALGALGEFGFALTKPFWRWFLQRSLRRFPRYVSSRGTSAAPSRGTT